MSRGSPREVFGPYLVYEPLGSGGMAEVHRAEQSGIEGFKKVVALKRMLPHAAANEEMVAAFVREARLASYLRHANVAQTYDLGKVDDTYFIAMELIEGRNLREVLRRCAQVEKMMPVAYALNILNQICDALDYAHNLKDHEGRPLGIIHRDVSPSNVIVAEDGVVKLIDFGIAKASAQGMQTQSGTVKGKFGYMAPEYLQGKLDARADLFAVGVIAHELLTSRPLFSSGDDIETLRRVREMQVAPPSRRNPQVPPEIDDIVMTALERDPDARWQHATALRSALTTLTRRLGLQVMNKEVVEWLDAIDFDSSTLPRHRDELDGGDSVMIEMEPSHTHGGDSVVITVEPSQPAHRAGISVDTPLSENLGAAPVIPPPGKRQTPPRSYDVHAAPQDPGYAEALRRYQQEQADLEDAARTGLRRSGPQVAQASSPHVPLPPSHPTLPPGARSAPDIAVSRTFTPATTPVGRPYEDPLPAGPAPSGGLAYASTAAYQPYDGSVPTGVPERKKEIPPTGMFTPNAVDTTPPMNDAPVPVQTVKSAPMPMGAPPVQRSQPGLVPPDSMFAAPKRPSTPHPVQARPASQQLPVPQQGSNPKMIPPTGMLYAPNAVATVPPDVQRTSSPQISPPQASSPQIGVPPTGMYAPAAVVPPSAPTIAPGHASPFAPKSIAININLAAPPLDLDPSKAAARTMMSPEASGAQVVAYAQAQQAARAAQAQAPGEIDAGATVVSPPRKRSIWLWVVLLVLVLGAAAAVVIYQLQ